jgi:EAL domain-containing protein (putative c-di-GMP-specific phosphodiesterase class I)
VLGGELVTPGSPLDDSLARDVARALAEDEFFLVYQPEIDLHSNGFAGVEALIRWRHPRMGVLSPAEFIALLEASGDIVAVGRWALENACYQGAEWHAKGYRFAVAVNASVRQLRHDDFVRDVDRSLDSSRFDPTHLTIEFSFEVLGDPAVLENLTELRARGVHLAIDDFAPGRPSFDHLSTLPIDILKLDRQYVATASSTTDDMTIRDLVRRARELNVRVFASGVEDASQRDHLRDEHVAVGQGFHFAHPYTVEEIDRFLEDFALFSGRPL